MTAGTFCIYLFRIFKFWCSVRSEPGKVHNRLNASDSKLFKLVTLKTKKCLPVTTQVAQRGRRGTVKVKIISPLFEIKQNP